MLSLPDSVRVYLASKPTDMRKSIEGLVALVRTTVAADPFAGHLFVFVGGRRYRVKVLLWDRCGFDFHPVRPSRSNMNMLRSRCAGR